MSALPNEYAYAKQFVGNLHKKSEPVPARVDTVLLVMIGEAARELHEYSRQAPLVPQYELHQGQDLPLHPTLQAAAVGRHYFSW